MSNNQGILKKHSSRLVAGAEMGSQGGEDAWKGKMANRTGDPTCTEKPKGTTGEQDRR